MFTAQLEEIITWWSRNIIITIIISFSIITCSNFPSANGYMPLAFYAGNSVASYLECPIVLDRDENIKLICLSALTHTHSFEVPVQTNKILPR